MAVVPSGFGKQTCDTRFVVDVATDGNNNDAPSSYLRIPHPMASLWRERKVVVQGRALLQDGCTFKAIDLGTGTSLSARVRATLKRG